MSDNRRVVLVIYDGWGMEADGPHNAISSAKTPCFDRLWENYPHTLLEASGEAVGLPKGTMGNSEVGHFAIGTGKPPETALVQISETIANNQLGEIDAIAELISHVKSNNSKLHLLGLLSDGKVHSDQEHLFAITKFVKEHGVKRVAIHAITDGRDTPPTSGAGYLRDLEREIGHLTEVSVASLVGRFYAMDRDKRKERTEAAVEMLFDGKGDSGGDQKPDQVLEEKYAQGSIDEQLSPIVFNDEKGNPILVEDGDGLLFFNFRPDRAIQLSQRIVERSEGRNIHFVTMTSYDESIKAPVAIPPKQREVNLAKAISDAGMRQLHVAETEKYAHVTYFLNGGIDTPVKNEDRILIPSNDSVATYDLAPEMRAAEIAGAVVNAIEKGDHQFIVLNFANPDMVGHTGNLEAAIQAIEHTDNALTKVADACEAHGVTLVITSDHGNAEVMVDPESGERKTAHTTSKVPLIVTDSKYTLDQSKGGLADVAPTVLDLLGIEKPSEMTGESLLTCV